MRWKQILTDYFSFSRRDRIAIIVLLIVIMGVILAPHFMYPEKPFSGPVTDTAWISLLRSMEKTDGSDPDPYAENHQELVYDRTRSRYSKKQAELFPFDPNTLPAEGWKRLGLRTKTIGTILNFVSKGGRFRKADDLRKIYGLFPDEYERLSPYIRIPPADPANTIKTNTERIVNRSNPAVSSRRYETVDINLADTGALIALPGIGSKLAGRIISFRNKLGGFYKVEQVAEVYGLQDSNFQKLKPYLKLENAVLKKISINSATLDELKAHPYIRYQLANPIVAFRKEHGMFEKLEDLMKIMAISKEDYQKMLPYLAL